MNSPNALTSSRQLWILGLSACVLLGAAASEQPKLNSNAMAFTSTTAAWDQKASYRCQAPQMCPLPLMWACCLLLGAVSVSGLRYACAHARLGHAQPVALRTNHHRLLHHAQQH
jgi:hypothetical protein